MSALDDILGALPADQISQQVGASPDEVRTAAAAVLPALLGGLQANAGDPSGADSILQALGQHDDDLLTGGADLSAIDEEDGSAIASHIFGDQQDEVVDRLGGLPAVGGSGAGGALVRKLLPILAPMVLSWLANRVLKGGGPAGGGGPVGGGGATGGGGTGGTTSVPTGTSPSLPGGGTGGAPGGLQDMLRDVLGSATGAGAGTASGSGPASGGSAGGFDPGSIIGDVLGGILGGGRR
ncbi:MAG TPA: DUF937 domain-containing protein [Ornithinibacter sp.]|nr:DUF937 domain-containing protein [Ornithinibacter sp.]